MSLRRRSTAARSLPLLALTLLAACGSGSIDGAATSPPPEAQAGHAEGGFVERAGELEIVNENVSGEATKQYIIEANGPGVCSFDYDRDGDEDLYFVNGQTLDGSRHGRSTLYRNRGDGKFDDVTTGSGTGDDGWGFGCSVADYDQDGWLDLFVSAYGPDRLYHNLSGVGFEQVAAAAGVHGDNRWGAASSWGDYDRDGLPDLYVGNYLEFDPTEPPPGPDVKGYRGLANLFKGPRGLPAQPDQLYRNQGDGTFLDVSIASGILRVDPAYSLAVAFVDADSDGWLDVLVANDSMPNYLLRNDHNGRFKDVAVPLGFAYSGGGAAQASMGIAWGDLDENGFEDALITNFSEDTNTLLLSNGMGFTDASFEAGLVSATWLSLAWGTVFFDYDHDGHLDLFAANGHVYPHIASAGLDMHYAQPDQLFRGDGKGGLTPVVLGDLGTLAAVSRGAIVTDIDRDGDLDVVVVVLDGRPLVYENRASAGAWVAPLLVGTHCDRDAFGAVARLRREGMEPLRRSVFSGGTYASTSQLRLHFGLATETGSQEIDVTWPCGARESYRVESKTFPQLVEGRGARLADAAVDSTKSAG